MLEPYSAFFYTPLFYPNGKSYYFEKPVEIIEANDPSSFTNAFTKIDTLLNKRLKGYALISYETGYFFEERLLPLLPQNRGVPLIQFVFFDSTQAIALPTKEIDFSSSAEILKNFESPVENFRITTSKAAYKKNISKIKTYIEEGETYQVNYTIKGKFDISGSIANLFLYLIFNQTAPFSAFINNSKAFIISTSPELFFKICDDKIITQPMKGTLSRGKNLEEDLLKKNELHMSEKNRAENIMIVDLLRNDLAKIAKMNCVRPVSMFDVHKYESLFQMISTVEADLEFSGISGVLRNLFPCGSITGAPKIRTMEIIRELEKEPRDYYTGSIGIFDDNQSTFNVAIRTIKINKENSEGEIGIGSGIIYDSDPENEYAETLLKSNFLTKSDPYFEIFETLLFEEGSFFMLDLHLERMINAADYFLFYFDKGSSIRK